MNSNDNMNMNMLMMALGRSFDEKSLLSDFICKKMTEKQLIQDSNDLIFKILTVFGGFAMLEKMSFKCTA